MHYWVRASPADFAGAIPQPRSGHTAVNIGKSKVVVFGGLIDKKFLSDITVYDIENKLWFQPECTDSGSDGQVGPSPRAFHVAVATDCHMFIFGGRSGSRRLGDFWVLDTDIWQWSELTSFGDLPSARDFAAASAIGNSKIVMFGGWDGKKWLSDVYILDTMTLEWKELAVLGTIPPPRCGHTATMVDKRLLVYGGKGGGGSIMDDLWALKGLIEEENESPGWTQLKIPGRAPTARCGHTVTSGGLHPLLFGGHGTGDCLSQYAVYYNDCVVLDRVSVQWKRLVTTNESPVARAYHSMTSIGSRYLLFGGFDGKSTYGDLWWLVPEDFQVPIREDLIMERLQEEARKISEYAVSHQKEVDKIVIYEQFFIELLQNKPQENIGIKIIGHLSDDLFLSCTGKHDVAKELHNEFQELILDVNWDPFQVVEVEDGVSIYQLSSQKNERLERLGEYGEEGAAIVDVIIATKRELMEYNSSGCYKIPKIWNFDDFRVATASECCDFTRQWLRVQAIKARRYDDRFIRHLLHTYLKLEVDSSHTVHMFLCEGILGARTTKSLIDPLYRAIVEGTAEPKAAITKHQRYFRCLSLEDRNAFASGLLTSLEERVFLGDCTSNIEICDVLRLFTREDMLSYEIIEDYLDQIDHPQFLASVEFFFKKM